MVGRASNPRHKKEGLPSKSSEDQKNVIHRAGELEWGEASADGRKEERDQKFWLTWVEKKAGLE